MEKREHSYTVGGIINWYSHCGEQYGGSSKKKQKIELSYDSAIPLLGIYLVKTIIRNDSCTSVHYSTIYNSHDMEATYVSINRGMNKEDVVHIYHGILFSH